MSDLKAIVARGQRASGRKGKGWRFEVGQVGPFDVYFREQMEPKKDENGKIVKGQFQGTGQLCARVLLRGSFPAFELGWGVDGQGIGTTIRENIEQLAEALDQLASAWSDDEIFARAVDALKASKQPPARQQPQGGSGPLANRVANRQQ